ncbi:uncharacterized protein FFE2_14887 [Fusarium fujikuroi]|nr:uncharacterized protein FFE2_14887 [Fusarium fujikuroi]
MPIKEPP